MSDCIVCLRFGYRRPAKRLDMCFGHLCQRYRRVPFRVIRSVGEPIECRYCGKQATSDGKGKQFHKDCLRKSEALVRRISKRTGTSYPESRKFAAQTVPMKKLEAEFRVGRSKPDGWRPTTEEARELWAEVLRERGMAA